MNVFWGINNYSDVKILKFEDFKALKHVITDFDESGKPITSVILKKLSNISKQNTVLSPFQFVLNLLEQMKIPL